MTVDAVVRLAAALQGRYRIERELGAGGMATVYLAEDLKHDRRVAIKVLKPELTAVLGGDRFLQEIKTTAQLQHPHILPLFDSGTADGFLFYVMPYIDGETLRARLDREAQLAIDEAVRIARDVADALDYAHRHGVVHRDIKPENILLHDGRPVVADFGIALALSAAAGGRMTETGTSVGTPHYMAPEQATGDRQITGRADTYALASVLYEMLAGDPPHTGSSAQQVIMRIIADPPRPVDQLRKSVPPNVADATMQALEKLPADRFETAKAFADALGDAGFRTAAKQGRRTAAPTRRPVGLAVVFGVALLATAVAAGWWLGARRGADDPLVARVAIPLDEDDLAGTGRLDVYANRSRPSITALALSPNGHNLVYAGNRNGVRQLFRRPIDSAAAAPIPGTEGAEYPVFSPDGASLLFWASGWLRRVPLEGGPPVQVAAVARFHGAAWGEDGWIVFRDTDLTGLRRVREAGGPVETLPSAPDAHLPHVLPGGNVVLYTVPGTGAGEATIESLRLSDGARSTVIADAADARYLAPGHLVFARHGALMAVPFDAATATVSGAPFGVLADLMQAEGGRNLFVRSLAAQYALSPAGHLAWLPGGTTRPYTYRPAWLDRTGSRSPIGLPAGSYLTLRISPDGRRIALAAIAPGNPGLWIADADGANSRRLVNEGVAWVVWSPDGRRLVYGVRDDVALIDARGGTAPERLPLATAAPALWTDDDEILFLERQDSVAGYMLRAVSLKTKDVRTVVADAGGTIHYPALSPDGRWLAYTVRTADGTQAELVVRPWPSVDDRRVLATGVIIGTTWGPGGELIYATVRDDEPHVMSLRLDTAGLPLTEARELFLGEVGSASPIRSWDLSADGQRILALQAAEDDALAEPPVSAIHLVLNWATELEGKR